MTPTPPPPDRWHASAGQLAAYIDGAVPQVQAWSLEAHLIGCPDCRAALSSALAGSRAPVTDVLREVRFRLDVLPEQVRAPRASSLRSLRSLRRIWMIAGPRRPLFGSWLLSLVLVLLGALLLDHLYGPRFAGLDGVAPGQAAASWFRSGGSWLILIAPLLPLIGVTIAYGPGLDPGYELVAATPSGGLRLVLWRTAGVLVVTLPAAAGVQLAGGSTRVVPWLLPGLALVLATLALGTVLGLARAGTVIAGLWVAGTSVPVMIGLAPPLLTVVPAPAWLALAVASTGLALARHERFAQLGPGAPATPAGGWA